MPVAIIETNAADAPATASTASTAPVSANGLSSTTDSRGRKIEIKRPNARERYRLIRMLGAQGAQNQEQFAYAVFAASTRSLDGDPIMFPQSEMELEVIIDRLGDEGLQAVTDQFAKMAGIGEPEDPNASAKN